MISSLSHSIGFFLVHSNYILLWRIEWMNGGGKGPPLFCMCMLCARGGLKLILVAFLDFFPHLFTEAKSFAEPGDCHPFWLVLVANLSQGYCLCLLSTGITDSHHMCLLGFYVGSLIWVMVLIRAWWELYSQSHFPLHPFKRKFRQNANANEYFPRKVHSKWSYASKF